MSACATGCGRESVPNTVFCNECAGDWFISPEWQRYDKATSEAACDAARADFANRIRAERQNGRPE